MSHTSVLKIRLSFKGRPLRSYSFTDDVVAIGRDPEAEICLDNTGVSRQHAKFEKTPDGFYLEDLGSANGTFLNDEPVSRDRLCDQDVIRIGKFSLWVSLESDKRGTSEEMPRVNPQAFQGTTVLTNDQLARVMASNKTAEEVQPELKVLSYPETAQAQAQTQNSGRFDRVTIVTMGCCIVLGAAVAGVVMWWLGR